ncbi:PRKR-interacting protein 1 [Purpureocillium lavendulum]|uniref:PRKR-interacting protein 1 n=1 Tax=Purpureocillium lavendulum TaxID=1247861 RepID=A0AB34FT85_9HYPO|nr:PRKR-interacting protein 1 [Purpureocillium lavendulum]
MSGEGPESVPTSADPRSHRPTKKRALTPVSAQAASVDALFANPDRPVRVPPAHSQVARLAAAPPPETVAHVQGSSAGAGSGEFHVYKASRRREYERLRAMDDELRREKGQEEFEREKKERDRRDEERTRKNREKRDKMKARKGKKGKGGAGGGGTVASNGGAGAPANAVGAPVPTADGDPGHAEGGRRTDAGNVDDATAATTKSAGLIIHDDD